LQAEKKEIATKAAMDVLAAKLRIDSGVSVWRSEGQAMCRACCVYRDPFLKIATPGTV
jgi:hypothetical protein